MTARLVGHTYRRRRSFFATPRRLVSRNRTRCSKEIEALQVRNVGKITACIDKLILDGYGVAPDADADSSPDEHGFYATGSDDGAGNVSMSHDVGGACLKHSHTRVGGAIGDDVGEPGINDSDPVRGSLKYDTGRAVAWADNNNWVGLMQ